MGSGKCISNSNPTLYQVIAVYKLLIDYWILQHFNCPHRIQFKTSFLPIYITVSYTHLTLPTIA